MFASRLLRVLEAVPTDVKHETSICEEAKQDTAMKEHLNFTLNDSESFGTEVDDPLSFESKKVQLHGPEKDNHILVFKVKRGDGCWNPKFVDDLPLDDEIGTGGKKDQNEHMHRPSDPGAQGDSLSTGDLELECSLLTTAESTPGNKNACRDSTNLYTDKDVSDFDKSELIVCYREVHHVVKDIGIDEGIPLSGDGHCEKSTEQSSDTELVPLLDNGKDVFSANEEGSRENNGSQEKLDSDKGVVGHCGLEDLIQKGETNMRKPEIAASEEDSFVDIKLPLQEFGTRSFLRSFLDSMEGEGSRVEESPDEQFSLGEVVSECLDSSSAEADSAQLKKLHYNSKVESGSITFNFSTNQRAGNVRRQDTKEENNICKEESLAQCPTDSQAIAYRSSISQQLGKYDSGETSFSSGGLVPCSDPVPFSGSVSLRSDGSATSARSFAFPILQPEWDSSPVRMTEAEGRNCRKHKGWRSGLPCCYF